MNRRLISCLMVAIGAGLVGCNGETEEPAAPEPVAPQEQPQTQEPAPPPAEPESRARPMEAVPPPPPEVQERTAASPTGGGTPAAPAEQPAQSQRQRQVTPAPRPQQTGQPAAPTPTAGTPQERARALLDQLFVQIGENKWAEGEKTLAELQKLKSSVPREMQNEIDNARASFQASKEISNQTR